MILYYSCLGFYSRQNSSIIDYVDRRYPELSSLTLKVITASNPSLHTHISSSIRRPCLSIHPLYQRFYEHLQLLPCLQVKFWKDLRIIITFAGSCPFIFSLGDVLIIELIEQKTSQSLLSELTALFIDIVYNHIVL